MKSYGLTIELLGKLEILNLEEVDGISSVGVKSVDITRNTKSEGNLLGQY